MRTSVDDVEDSLFSKLLSAEVQVPQGSCWRHRKGGEYVVDCCALVEADLSIVVIYRLLGTPGPSWSRPFHEFTDGRFARIDEGA